METIAAMFIQSLILAFIGSAAGSYSAGRKVPPTLKPKTGKWILSILKGALSGASLTVMLEICLLIAFPEAEVEKMQQTVAFAVGIGFGMFFMRNQIKKNV